jgi:hypothetical protein
LVSSLSTEESPNRSQFRKWLKLLQRGWEYIVDNVEDERAGAEGGEGSGDMGGYGGMGDNLFKLIENDHK